MSTLQVVNEDRPVDVSDYKWIYSRHIQYIHAVEIAYSIRPSPGRDRPNNTFELFLKVCIFDLNRWLDKSSHSVPATRVYPANKKEKKEKEILNNGSSSKSMHLKNSANKQPATRLLYFLWWQSSIFCAPALVSKLMCASATQLLLSGGCGGGSYNRKVMYGSLLNQHDSPRSVSIY